MTRPAVPARLTRWLVAVAATALALDQATKSWAVATLDDRTIDVVWTLRFALSLNSGAAFSLGRGLTPLFMAAGVVLLAGLLLYSRRVTSLPMAIALGMVIGGASGNLTDRFLRGHDGAVIDFIDFQWWPVFNVADIFVVCGAILLVLTATDEDEAEAGDRPPTEVNR